MDFKKFFILQERAYFTNLAALSDRVVNTLQDKLAKKKSIRSGDTITVPLSKTTNLDIKLYKGYSNAARAAMQNGSMSDDEKALALYFPKTENSNGRIEVYVNASKKSNNYYRERKFEDFINKSLPKYIKEILYHEIAHAYEDIVSDVLRHKEDEPEKAAEYFNSDVEMNAYLNQFVTHELTSDPTIRSYITSGQTNDAANHLLRKLSNKRWVTQLTDDNKKWVIKTVYTFVSRVIDKYKMHDKVAT